MNSQSSSASINDSFEVDFEAAGIASVVRTRSQQSSFRQRAYEIDDNKVPPVFGTLWREVISVFTLACAPSLNVFHLHLNAISDDRL